MSGYSRSPATPKPAGYKGAMMDDDDNAVQSLNERLAMPRALGLPFELIEINSPRLCGNPPTELKANC
jgi:hypothetical protein